MEYVSILCCGSKEGGYNSISSIITGMTRDMGITIEHRTSMCFADFVQEEVDEENEEMHEPIEFSAVFSYKSQECKMDIEKITNIKNGKQFFGFRIEYKSEDDIVNVQDSVWYEFKEMLLLLLDKNFERIFWLSDSQNEKIATDLYQRIHKLENYLRETINYYMAITHGGEWFEKYSYESYVNKYLKFSEWFRKSRYNLFKKVDSHLYNLEIDDVFDALKTAKKKQLTTKVKKALEEIKSQEKDKATDIADVNLLDFPSLWEEERFDEIFSGSVVGRWENDLSKRRNMIAHNKMICRDMYLDTLKLIEQFYKEFEKASQTLKNRIVSEELVEIRRLQRDSEIAMNLEYCELNSELLEEQDIIERLNETDDFICLSGIINDRVAYLAEYIEEILGLLEDANSSLNEDAFFEDGELVRGDLLIKYIELARSHYLYKTWKSLFEKGISNEIYQLIEIGIAEYISDLIEKLNSMKNNIFYVNLDCFSEGDLVRLKDLEGNIISINLSGWFCPERGAVNEVYVNWRENGENCAHGGIYISYGDYEMTDDDIPIPCVEDEMVVNFGEINSMLEIVVDDIFKKLGSLEDELIDLEL